MPDSLLSYRDPQFTSKLWHELNRQLGLQLRRLTSNHLQTDGRSEVMNKMPNTCHRLFSIYLYNNWDQLLATAEFSYNLSVHKTTEYEPFFFDLGWDPWQTLHFLWNYSSPVQAVTDLQ